MASPLARAAMGPARVSTFSGDEGKHEAGFLNRFEVPVHTDRGKVRKLWFKAARRPQHDNFGLILEVQFYEDGRHGFTS